MSTRGRLDAESAWKQVGRMGLPSDMASVDVGAGRAGADLRSPSSSREVES